MSVITEGTTIGTYRVLRKLGEGGMGVVYLAEHTLLGRKAAIKVLLPELSAHQQVVQRFFNEAKAVTQIADPGIVQVFDFGYHTDNSAFIVMELLEGEAMDKRLERIGRFHPTDCLRLMRLICQSLESAHAKGVVHRDLKPENIFIVGDPAVTGGERAKILDFGIAKLTADEPGKMKTRTGMLMGTPVYMSPEQCRGAGEVDTRSDIYTMGCVMMTMLTGRPPFEAEGSGELVVAHLREPPPLAASRLPGLPEMFDQILQRCLAKSPADRFPTMTELAKTLGYAEQMMFQTSQPTIAGDLPAYMGSGLTPPPGMRTPSGIRPSPMPGAMAMPGTMVMPPGGIRPAVPAIPGSHPGTMVLPTPTTLTGAAGQTAGAASGKRGLIIATTAMVLVLGGIGAFLATRKAGSTAAAGDADVRPSAVTPAIAHDAAEPIGADAHTVVVATPPAAPADAGVVDAKMIVEANAMDAGVAAVVKLPQGANGSHKTPKGPSAPRGNDHGSKSVPDTHPVDRGD